MLTGLQKYLQNLGVSYQKRSLAPTPGRILPKFRDLWVVLLVVEAGTMGIIMARITWNVDDVDMETNWAGRRALG